MGYNREFIIRKISTNEILFSKIINSHQWWLLNWHGSKKRNVKNEVLKAIEPKHRESINNVWHMTRYFDINNKANRQLPFAENFYFKDIEFIMKFNEEM